MSKIKKELQDKYNITFPVKKNQKAEAELDVKLYEGLREKDKYSVNFNENYGENRYKKTRNFCPNKLKNYSKKSRSITTKSEILSLKFSFSK
ncbi:hypothetical protein [Chryseobacterium indoltheticum]|uniref:hypothetical protein n=1 Tax=Chryseobacterium indoltheticum TaxID=254 RepID=UPI003F49217C